MILQSHTSSKLIYIDRASCSIYSPSANPRNTYMKANKHLSTLLNTNVYILNNGDIYLKIAGTLHRIGTTSNSATELQSEAYKYTYTS